MKKGIILVISVCIALFWTILPQGCANIIPPSGGPKDTIPPELEHVDPRDSSVNFRSKHVTFTFNENIDVQQQDLSTNVMFTPTFETNPEIKVKGRNMTLTFHDSLLSNTTYVLNFGNAIKDNTEGNPIRNFSYTFSTGPTMDSLEISGRVILAENGGTDTTMIALLYKDLRDSAVVRERPLYVTRLNQRGEFHFRFLPQDSFAVYALGDAGVMRRYQSKNQLFAFSNSHVMAGKADSLVLYAYREAPQANRLTVNPVNRAPATDRRLRFTQNITGEQDLLSDYVLTFPVPLRNFDSNKIHLTTDSVFNATTFSASLDTARKELMIRSQWKEGTKYNLILDRDFATDTSGRQLLKTDTLFFTTRKQSDYGNLVIRLHNLDLSKHPVLQFVQNGQVAFSAPLTTATFSRSLFLPGEYDLSILYDVNGNGHWDPGNFFGIKRQPELVKPIDQKINVKANWDNEFDRSLQ
ncbi:MAG: Ig-like domain-containing protein [Flavisolibacter sp.]